MTNDMQPVTWCEAHKVFACSHTDNSQMEYTIRGWSVRVGLITRGEAGSTEEDMLGD
jgi:hypothetical protein